MKYLIDSFSKFKNDMLSKVFYDLFKYLFITFILVLVLTYVPVVKEKLELEVSSSVWSIFVYSLLLVGISLTMSFLLFNRRFKKIQSESQIDELTGLKNYKALELDLHNLVGNWSQNVEPISLILLDIDDFKKFNDDHTYPVADKILSKLGNLLTKDSRITDETYRYFMRGDEFLIVARNTSISNAQIAAERKRKLIADSTFHIGGNNFKFTVSCGVTEFNRNEEKAEVFDRVILALQKAKKKVGKNCTEIIV